MTRLLIADTKRFWARRITRYFPLALVALMTVGVVIAYFVIENDSGTPPDFTNDIAGGADASTVLGPVALLLPIVAFVIGASFVGADMKTGMLEQILTWEPRRLRVLLGRCLASFVNVGILACLLSAYLVLALFVLSMVLGTSSGTTGELWLNIAGKIALSGLASGLFAMFGVGVTVLAGSSLGAIVGFVIYWFIGEQAIVGTFVPKASVWLPVINASAFANNSSVEYIDGSVFGEDFEIATHHGPWVAGLIMMAWVVAGAAAGAYRLVKSDID